MTGLLSPYLYLFGLLLIRILLLGIGRIGNVEYVLFLQLI